MIHLHILRSSCGSQITTTKSDCTSSSRSGILKRGVLRYAFELLDMVPYERLVGRYPNFTMQVRKFALSMEEKVIQFWRVLCSCSRTRPMPRIHGTTIRSQSGQTRSTMPCCLELLTSFTLSGMLAFALAQVET